MPEGISFSRSSSQIASSIKRDRRQRVLVVVAKFLFGCSGGSPFEEKKQVSSTAKSPWTKTQWSPRDGASEAAGNRLVALSIAELRKVANDFREDALIGGGDLGNLYKGSFSPTSSGAGTTFLPVAVKVQDGLSRFQSHRERWLAEVIFMGQLSHPNLVKLVGYCCDGGLRALVYEYMPLGSVESHLFSSRSSMSSPPLPWAARMRIAMGAARGLAFLHGAEPVPLIYRDFKTSRILLDSSFNAKLSDYFGLAKDDGPPAGDDVSTVRVMRACDGYVAPEYLMTDRLTASCNVYSYGVVLLELLTGQPPLDLSRPLGEQELARWAFPALQHKKRVLRIIDPRLLLADGGAPPVRAVHKVAMLAYRCLKSDPKARPLMPGVVARLERLQQPAVRRTNFS